MRTGGFGGAEALAAYLREQSIHLVVDATHPFAARITRNAAHACAAAGVPRLVLARPPWARQAGDTWVEAADAAAAAGALPELGRRAFLAIGRRELAAFTRLDGIWFLVRLVEPPEAAPPLARCRVIYGRGPFACEDETRLLRDNAIDVVVSKNSGGAATYAKIAAARGLGLPVVMIARPSLPASETVTSVDQALAWIDGRLR